MPITEVQHPLIQHKLGLMRELHISTREFRTLAAEVRDLKDGRKAIEERARTDLGMVKTNETFFQVVPPATDAVPAIPVAPETGQRTAQAATP